MFAVKGATIRDAVLFDTARDAVRRASQEVRGYPLATFSVTDRVNGRTVYVNALTGLADWSRGSSCIRFVAGTTQ